MKLLLWSFFLIAGFSVSESADCDPTVTTVTHITESIACSKKIIFEDQFDRLNMKVWRHENTLSGGGVSLFYHNSFYYNSYICLYNCRIRNSNGTQTTEPTVMSKMDIYI